MLSVSEQLRSQSAGYLLSLRSYVSVEYCIQPQISREGDQTSLSIYIDGHYLSLHPVVISTRFEKFATLPGHRMRAIGARRFCAYVIRLIQPMLLLVRFISRNGSWGQLMSSALGSSGLISQKRSNESDRAMFPVTNAKLFNSDRGQVFEPPSYSAFDTLSKHLSCSLRKHL